MEDILIAAVFKREPLWNPSNRHYKNVLILKKLWKEVAQEVNKDEKTVRGKWKNLRTYFFRQLRKLDTPKSGDPVGDDFTSTWQFFKQMMFLKNTIAESQRETNFESVTADSNEGAESPDAINMVETASQSSAASSTRSERYKIKQQLKRSHNERHEEQFEKRKIELLFEKDGLEQDEDLLFFQSLLPYMKKIPLRKKLKLRSVIQDAILEQLPTDSNECSCRYF